MRLLSSTVFFASICGLAFTLGCDGGSHDKPDPKAAPDESKSEGKTDAKAKTENAWTWELPKGLGKPPEVPEDNPMSAEKVALGHKLFMDMRLSVDGSRSCYSCHQNHLGNADGRKTAMGAQGKILSRNTPTIWNVAYHPALYWDGRAPSLEKQALGAMKGGNMGLGDTIEDKAAEIAALPEYKDAFREVFELADDAQVQSLHIAQAISAYERTLLCGDTPYDTGELEGAALRGRDLFVGKAGCTNCHSGPALSDGMFHVVGIAIDPSDPDADVGRYKVSKANKDKFAFRTPTLRNVSKTAPYFHDGSVETLEEAVKLMSGGGVAKPGVVLDSNLLNRQLSAAEQADLVAFLKVLDCPGALEEIGDQQAEGIAAAPA